MRDCILVTGGLGFIGAHFVRQWLRTQPADVVVLDKFTYAGNPQSLFESLGDPRVEIARGDIGDFRFVADLLARCEPRAIVNFAAESHVDRSILGPEPFLQTNVTGTFRLLEAARDYWAGLSAARQLAFRFLHVSTDEVFGSLNRDEPPFRETSQYAPNSPYAASKAAADHLVRAWHRTYGLPTLLTNCSNNYGPAQFPEKLIPLMILSALEGKALPIYGDGMNLRDWLYVTDHCDALDKVLHGGIVGETYCVGGNDERSNIEVVRCLCQSLDVFKPRADGRSYWEQHRFVDDRPGHDRRYAIDSEKIGRELGWAPKVRFEEGLASTVSWYLQNTAWTDAVRSGEYMRWIDQNYAGRSRS